MRTTVRLALATVFVTMACLLGVTSVADETDESATDRQSRFYTYRSVDLDEQSDSLFTLQITVPVRGTHTFGVVCTDAVWKILQKHIKEGGIECWLREKNVMHKLMLTNAGKGLAFINLVENAHALDSISSSEKEVKIYIFLSNELRKELEDESVTFVVLNSPNMKFGL